MESQNYQIALNLKSNVSAGTIARRTKSGGNNRTLFWARLRQSWTWLWPNHQCRSRVRTLEIAVPLPNLPFRQHLVQHNPQGLRNRFILQWSFWHFFAASYQNSISATFVISARLWYTVHKREEIVCQPQADPGSLYQLQNVFADKSFAKEERPDTQASKSSWPWQEQQKDNL